MTPVPPALKPLQFKSSYIQSLSTIIRAGLFDAIATHGPITKNNVTSAVKRVVGKLKGYKHERDARYHQMKRRVFALHHFE